MLYKTLKELPGIPVGTEFEYNQYATGLRSPVTCSDLTIERQLNRFIDTFGIDNDFFAPVEEKPKSIWDLKDGDIWWGIDNWKGIVSDVKWENLKGDYSLREMGNCFLTKEEAEHELAKRKAIAKIHKYCWENGISREYVYEGDAFIFRIRDYGSFAISQSYRNGNPIGYFSKENAEKILELFAHELKIILS